jgi:hypothetical protein
LGTDVAASDAALVRAFIEQHRMPPSEIDRIHGFPSGSAAAWSMGTEKIPRRCREDLEMGLELLEYQVKLKRLGFYTCTVERSLWARIEGKGREVPGIREDEDLWSSHRKSCATCRADQARVNREGGPKPRMIRPTLTTRWYAWTGTPTGFVVALGLALSGAAILYFDRGKDQPLLTLLGAVLIGHVGTPLLGRSWNFLTRLRDGSGTSSHHAHSRSDQ